MRKLLNFSLDIRLAFGCLAVSIFAYSYFVSFRVYPPTGVMGYDREVFRYIGMIIAEGAFPYRDAFDHKPPLIYLFSAFTQPFGEIIYWWLETLLLAFSALAVLWLAAKRSWPLWVLFPFYLIALLRFPDFFGSGGLTRSFSSYFITFALVCIFSDTKWKYFLIGAVATAIFFLQQNDAPALVLPFLWSLLNEKKTPKIRALAESAFGSMLILVPLFSWILLNGFFSDFLRDAFFFNTQTYAFGLGKWEILKLTADTMKMHYFKSWLVLCLGCLLLHNQWKTLEQTNGKKILQSPLVFLFSGLFVQTYLLNITGVKFEHYFLSVCPWLIFLSGESLRSVQLSWSEKIPTRFFWFISFLLLSGLPTQGLGRTFDGGFRVWKNYSQPVERLAVNLKTRLDSVRGKRGQFFVFANTPLLYANTEYNIIAPTRWAYHTFWQQIPQPLWDPNHEKLSEIFSGIEAHRTKFILDFSNPETIPSESALKLWQEFRDKNYKLIDRAHGGSLYERVVRIEEKE